MQTALVFSLVTAFSVQVFSIRVENDVFVRRSGETSDWKRDRPHRIASRDIIFAPLDDRRKVITKQRMYINAKDATDDSFYLKMLSNSAYMPQAAIEQIDQFFVTTPQPRTTVAVEEETEPTTTTTLPPPIQPVQTLRLVTLPRIDTTPPPPFKYTTRIPRENALSIAGFSPLLLNQANNLLSPSVRFPAQHWQRPQRDPSRVLDLWNPNAANQAPPDPFVSRPLAPLNISNPFIPIGRSNPAVPLNSRPYATPSPLLQPFRPPELPSHASPFRSGGFAKIASQAAIPLPSSPNVYAQMPPPQLPPNIPPKPRAIEYSIDSTATATKSDKAVPPRIFNYNAPRPVETPTNNARPYVSHYAAVAPRLPPPPKPTISRESQLILPKSYQQYRPQPVSHLVQTPVGLNPNQKLDLCCRKQQVSPICQNMCNFDTFNDKSLVGAFLTNQCPGPQLGKAYDCASSKADHSACCAQAGLLNFQNGRCMAFCRTHQATPANVFEYLPCLQVFDTIKNCYRSYQMTNKNIFGD